MSKQRNVRSLLALTCVVALVLMSLICYDQPSVKITAEKATKPID